MARPSENSFMVEVDRVVVPEERVRKTFDNMDLQKISMEDKGQLQEIVVKPLEGNLYQLITGERRLRCAKELSWSEIRCTYRENLSEDEALELELEENITRVDIPWLEEDEGIRRLHRLKKERFDKQKTYPGTWSETKTAQEIGLSQARVNTAIAVAEGAEKYPELRKCKNRTHARKLLSKIQRGTLSTYDSETLQAIRESYVVGNGAEKLIEMEKECVQCMIVDISDNVSTGIIAELIRVMKLPGHCWIFSTFSEQHKIVELLSTYDVNTVAEPYLWIIRNENRYIPFTWFSKNMLEPPKDMRSTNHHSTEDTWLSIREKPTALLELIIQRSTRKGEFVLDPFCYGINLPTACVELKRPFYAYCPDKMLHEKLMIREEEKDLGRIDV